MIQINEQLNEIRITFNTNGKVYAGYGKYVDVRVAYSRNSTNNS